MIRNIIYDRNIKTKRHPILHLNTFYVLYLQGLKLSLDEIESQESLMWHYIGFNSGRPKGNLLLGKKL